jgi:hypothetical protein
VNPLLLGPIFEIVGKVIDRVIPDTAAAEKAKLDMLQEATRNEFTAAMEQVKVNLAEAAHPSLFVAGWRPAIGWICGLGLFWNFVGYPMVSWAASLWWPNFVPPELVADNLMELTLGMLGMAGLRSWEKFKGVASK